jgi:ABC-2 type transport system permease protein
MMLTKFFAFLTHGFTRNASYRLDFAGRYLAMLVSVLFFYILDQLFKRAGVQQVEGSSYFTFLLIGGTFTRYLDTGLRAFSETLREEMLMGTLEPLLATATRAQWAMLGPALFLFLEGLLLMAMQLVVGVLFGADFSHANWLSAGVIVLISMIALAAWGITSAAYTLVYKRGDPIMWAVEAVAYVFIGVWFPVSILPPALQVVSYLLPFTYALHGLRAALTSGATLIDLSADVLPLLAFTLLLLPIALWSVRSALRRVKRSGNLGLY